MFVSEVGTGVGYLVKEASGEMARRFEGREKPGDEENGSNAGRSADACRFKLPGLGREGCTLTLLGDESIMLLVVYPAYLKPGLCNAV